MRLLRRLHLQKGPRAGLTYLHVAIIPCTISFMPRSIMKPGERSGTVQRSGNTFPVLHTPGETG